jgi:NADH:ubiquinone oxidoreductase subunit 6 (subunit J)
VAFSSFSVLAARPAHRVLGLIMTMFGGEGIFLFIAGELILCEYASHHMVIGKLVVYIL